MNVTRRACRQLSTPEARRRSGTPGQKTIRPVRAHRGATFGPAGADWRAGLYPTALPLNGARFT